MKGYTKTVARNIAATCMIGLSLCCCGSKAQGDNNTDNRDSLFRLPEIPAELTDAHIRAEYLAGHYWDCLNVESLDNASDSVTLEQAFADYLTVLPLVDDSVQTSSVRTFLDKLQDNRSAYGFFMDMAAKYLYEADSPLENEEMLIPFLSYATDSIRQDDYIRMRADYLKNLVMKNRAGTKASDFTFLTRDGKSGNLWTAEAERLLVIFYDPECTHCIETMSRIESDRLISRQVEDGTLKVLAVYTEGKPEIWKQTNSALPSEWIVAYDTEGILDREIYDLKAMPTLYLLDREKIVLEKNIDLTESDLFSE